MGIKKNIEHLALHSGTMSNPLIKLELYPDAAEEANMKLIPKFSFRRPLSLAQFLFVLFDRSLKASFSTVGTMLGDLCTQISQLFQELDFSM